MLTKQRPDVKRVCHQEAGAMIGLVMTTGATVEDAIAMMIAAAGTRAGGIRDPAIVHLIFFVG